MASFAESYADQNERDYRLSRRRLARGASPSRQASDRVGAQWVAMPEGLMALGEHATHSKVVARDQRGRWISISEAVLLSLVTLAAAWSGYAAAKWSTESSVTLAKASAERAKSNRAFPTALETRNLDSTFFNAWLNAYAARSNV